MAKTGLYAAAIASTLVLAGAGPLMAWAPPYDDIAADDTVKDTDSVAGISTKGLKKRDLKRLTRMLEGREAGRAQQCIQLRQVRRSAGLGDDILIYEMRGGNILVNRPRSGCNNLGGNGIINSTPDDRICEGQIFEVRDFRAGISLGGCSFGEFVEYTKTEAEAEDSAD
jgi:hypothetical protein